MRTDDLINKYIDGELDKDENDELRRLAGEDPLAKEDFNDSVLLNSVLKRDAASIELPNKLRKNVRARVGDMFSDDIRDARPIIPIYRFAASVAAVFILGFALISDIPALNYYHSLAKYGNYDVKQDTIYNVVKIAVPALMAHNSVSPYASENQSSAKAAESVAQPRSGNSNAEEAGSNSPAASEAMPESRQLSAAASDNNSIFDFNDAETDSTQNIVPAIRPAAQIRRLGFKFSDGSPFSSRAEASVRMPFEGSSKLSDAAKTQSDKNFEFVTSYGGYSGSNVFSSKKDKFSIGLSQSAGYRFSQRSKIGVEFGYMNYDYNEISRRTIKGDIHQGGAAVPVPIITVNVNNSISDRSIFGTVYYEYRLLHTSAFSLDLHSGLGTSRDGFININRISASVRIMKGVRLTSGLDGRIFNAEFPDSKIKAGKFCSALSLLYGLQIDL